MRPHRTVPTVLPTLPERRGFRALAAPMLAGLLILGGLAGCAGDDPGDSGAASPTNQGTTSSAATPGEETATRTADRTADGTEDPGGPSLAPATPRPGRVIVVDVKGKNVSPKPGRVQVAKGEQFTLVINADRSDTVHIHGFDVEQEVAPGEPTVIPLSARKTGVFDVELHEPETLLVQLVVR